MRPNKQKKEAINEKRTEKIKKNIERKKIHNRKYKRENKNKNKRPKRIETAKEAKEEIKSGKQSIWTIRGGDPLLVRNLLVGNRTCDAGMQIRTQVIHTTTDRTVFFNVQVTVGGEQIIVGRRPCQRR